MTDYDNVTKETRAHLDSSLDDLAPDINARLAASRERAMEQAVAGRRHRSRAPAAAVGVAASVAMVAVLATFTGGTDEPGPTAGDLELMTAEEPLEMYQDLEFYLWLEKQKLQTESSST